MKKIATFIILSTMYCQEGYCADEYVKFHESEYAPVSFFENGDEVSQNDSDSHEIVFFITKYQDKFISMLEYVNKGLNGAAKTALNVNGCLYRGSPNEIREQIENAVIPQKDMRPLDMAKVRMVDEMENGTFEFADLQIKNCTIKDGSFFFGEISKGELLYNGNIYSVGSKFLGRDNISHASVPF